MFVGYVNRYFQHHPMIFISYLSFLPLMYNLFMKLPSLASLIGIQREESPDKNIISAFDPDKLGPKKVYLSWSAPSRVEHKGGNAKLSRTLIIIGVFIGLLLIIMQEYFLILLVASLVFVNQAIKKVSPESVTHEISSHGFSYAGQLYYWHKLKRFFFSDNNLLIIDTYEVLPGRLFALYSPKDQKEIKDALEKHIHYLTEAPKTSFEKIYDSVVSKLNF